MATESIALPLSAAPPRPLVEQLHQWVTTVDHKRLGILYILYALLFLVLGGVEATIMRIQLIRPHNDFVSPQVFNRMFTMHGTTMIFFVAMPILFGFANYLIPLMIGARDMAYPRLNAFSFWMTAFGGLLLYFSFLGGDGLYGAGNAPDVGWFAYAPLTSQTFSRGPQHGLLDSVGIGFRRRQHRNRNQHHCHCPVHALPGNDARQDADAAVAESDDGGPGGSRRKSPHGCAIDAAGRSLPRWTLLRHAGRRLGRDVDALLLDLRPSGSVCAHHSPLLRSFPRSSPCFPAKAIFGYPIMVAATLCIGFISMSVWAHHMFTVGMSAAGNTFFVLTTMAIAVPTGIKIFNWLATMWGGQIQFKTPMLFCIAFLFQFLIAGLTGIMLGAAPFNWQLGNSYFVIAHFHYVIVGGILFALFGAFYYWFPKMSGRMYNETLGKLHFWLFVIGFHLTFDFMHIPGILGMPRRIYTYEPGRGWDIWNLIVTIGVFFQAAGVLVFLGNLLWSYRRGPVAGSDPWDAWTLEWSTTSPPPAYNFATVPEVRSRRPLWDLKHPEDPDWHYE